MDKWPGAAVAIALMALVGAISFLASIKTTPEQDAAIERKLREIAANEPQLGENLHIAFDNCSTRSNRGLDAGGIPPALGIGIGQGGASSDVSNHLPGSAGSRASHGLRPPDAYIPQGAGWQPRSISQFNRK